MLRMTPSPARGEGALRRLDPEHDSIGILQRANPLAANSAVEAANNTAELEAARIRFLGKKGEITLLYDDLGSMTLEERKSEGAANNALKFGVEEKRREKEAQTGKADDATRGSSARRST